MGYSYSNVPRGAPMIFLANKEGRPGAWIEGLFQRAKMLPKKDHPKRAARGLYTFRVIGTNVAHASTLDEETQKYMNVSIRLPGEYSLLGTTWLDRALQMVREAPSQYVGVPFKIEYLGQKKVEGMANAAHNFRVQYDSSYIGAGDQIAGDDEHADYAPPEDE